MGNDTLTLYGGSLIGSQIDFGGYLFSGGAGNDSLGWSDMGGDGSSGIAKVTLDGGDGNDTFGWNSSVTPTMLRRCWRR